MANETSSDMRDQKRRDLLVTSAAVIGCMAIFAIIVAVVYIPNLPEAPDVDAAQYRSERLETLRLETAGEMIEYSWINEQEGTVRLPIERAMDLVVKKYDGSELPTEAGE
ncbi:MAG: hypothetical protein ACFB21_09255 [Opitutales bacterium]